MARITPAAVAILLCLVQSSPLAFASTPIIDGNGVLTRASIPDSSIGSKGIVAVVNSPGTSSFFDTGEEGVTLLPSDDGASILSSSGATLSGTASLSMGNGAAAAASVAGSIIMSGITESDLEYGLHDSRHGQTLTGIFRAKIENIVSASSEEEMGEVKSTKLFLVLPQCEVDDEIIKKDVQNIFDSALAEKSITSINFDSVIETNIVKVESEEEAQQIMALASEAAAESSSQLNIASSIASAYSAANAASEVSSSTTAAILACDDSFARHNRAVRAKLASWKSRTARGLTVDYFGYAATQLVQRSMESYDRDTLIATGSSSSAASYRLEMRSKLQEKVESAIRELFKTQIEILEKTTLKKFNAMLLRQHGKDNVGKEQFYNDNAASVRAAAFSFETAVEDLEVPSLSLTKAKAVTEINAKLNTELLSFPDSPAARLKNMRAVTRAANKQKQPTERNIEVGLDLVAMLRPDGFGNLQGFVGYQYGGNNVIVGVHNDADAPDVISQFGGKRPPFVRVQPKLKVDVEL